MCFFHGFLNPNLIYKLIHSSDYLYFSQLTDRPNEERPSVRLTTGKQVQERLTRRLFDGPTNRNTLANKLTD